MGYFQEAGIDTYEAINCIYLGGETSNGESDINSQGGIEDTPHTGLTVSICRHNTKETEDRCIYLALI